jgi:hypothetical protein
VSYLFRSAPLEIVRLNATSFSNPSTLYINLYSETLKNIRTLIDSGSTNCFIDSRFAIDNNLKIENLKTPLHLTLFDSSSTSSGLIYQFTQQTLQFPCGMPHDLKFLLTSLDRLATAVLGYSWLHQKNPLIDWVTHDITFRTSAMKDQPADALRSASLRVPPVLTPPPVSLASSGSPPAATPASSPPAPGPHPIAPPAPSPPTAELRAAAAKIPISFVRAAAIQTIAQFPSSHPQSIVFSSIIMPDSCSACSAIPGPDDPNLSPMLAAEYAALRPQVPSHYHNYLDVFSKSKGTTLPPCRSYNHKIELDPGTTPPFGPIYLLSEVEQLALKEFLNENLANQFIHPSHSPSGAPILFIKKKDSSLRLAVDYRGLNKISKKDRYPLPLIPDLLDHLCLACVFTKVDLRSTYNLIRIADGDEWKTAFQTRYGSYKFLIMHYGLTNTPASFQQFMNDVFKDMLDVCVVIYLDDILIYSDDPAKHNNHVRKVLHCLRTNNLYTKIEKCEFSVTTMSFLGFVISPEGLQMDDLKIQVIRNWPTPRKVKDVQSFLGFANFY